MATKSAKRMTLKQAERKYEASPQDKREDKRGAEKILKQADKATKRR